MESEKSNKSEKGPFESVTFYKRQTKNVPVLVKFKRKDGSVVTIKTFKVVVVQKKVTFLRKKRK